MGNMLIVIIVAVIVLVILFVILFPVINMLFSRLIFGKYSAGYVNTVKKYTGKSPYPYCIKDDFINHVAGFFNHPRGLKQFDSDEMIVFSNVAFGEKFRSFLRKNPTPFCINSSRFPQFDLKVLGYRDKMFSVEMKKYFFFIDHVFVFGQITFKNPKPESLKEISAIVGKKYLGAQASLPETNYLISDKQGNSLLCENNGFHLTLGYLSGSHSDRLNRLKDYWHAFTDIKIKTRASLQKELMEKL